MIFNKHLDLEEAHAILSPSSYHWLNYDNEDAFFDRYRAIFAQAIGTSLHSLSKDLINHRIRLNKGDKKILLVHLLGDGIPKAVIDLDIWYPTIMNYVNDAIGFRMTPEVPLVYSENAFGTTDAISFRDDILRIHDLKTGVTPAKMDQLMLYAAYFCLEYKINPKDIQTKLRIYQSGQALTFDPEWEDISEVIDKVIRADKVIQKFRGME